MVQSYQDPDQNLVGWMFDDFQQCPSPRKMLHYKEGHFILSGGGTSLMTFNNGCSLIRLELTGNYKSKLRHNITNCLILIVLIAVYKVKLLKRIIAFFKLFLNTI